MGTDISGAIECRPVSRTCAPRASEPGWEFAIDLGQLYDTRDYDSFGCLFGVTNLAGFEPVAAKRGLPDDLAPQTAELAARWTYFSPTWVSWAEIAAVDWGERAARPDARIHEYVRDEAGQWRFRGKAGQNPRFARLVGMSVQESAQTLWPDGSEWLDGDVLYRAETLTRADAVRPDGPWRPVWSVMGTLAGLHGPDNVRLVVWFDRLPSARPRACEHRVNEVSDVVRIPSHPQQADHCPNRPVLPIGDDRDGGRTRGDPAGAGRGGARG